MANQHPSFRKNTIADWLRLWCHLVYLGGIVAPPSVIWHPDLKSGVKIRWQGLLSHWNCKYVNAYNYIQAMHLHLHTQVMFNYHTVGILCKILVREPVFATSLQTITYILFYRKYL